MARSKKKKLGNYLSGVVSRADECSPGVVNHIAIYHDDWCDKLAGRGPCNCNPTVGTPMTTDELLQQILRCN